MARAMLLFLVILGLYSGKVFFNFNCAPKWKSEFRYTDSESRAALGLKIPLSSLTLPEIERLPGLSGPVAQQLFIHCRELCSGAMEIGAIKGVGKKTEVAIREAIILE